MSEEDLIAERTNLVMEQWPRLGAAWGCTNCDLIFKTPESRGCPGCRSKSIFNLASALGHQRLTEAEVAEQATKMIERIDEVIEK